MTIATGNNNNIDDTKVSKSQNNNKSPPSSLIELQDNVRLNVLNNLPASWFLNLNNKLTENHLGFLRHYQNFKKDDVPKDLLKEYERVSPSFNKNTSPGSGGSAVEGKSTPSSQSQEDHNESSLNETPPTEEKSDKSRPSRTRQDVEAIGRPWLDHALGAVRIDDESSGPRTVPLHSLSSESLSLRDLGSLVDFSVSLPDSYIHEPSPPPYQAQAQPESQSQPHQYQQNLTPNASSVTAVDSTVAQVAGVRTDERQTKHTEPTKRQGLTPMLFSSPVPLSERAWTSTCHIPARLLHTVSTSSLPEMIRRAPSVLECEYVLLASRAA